MLAAGSGGSSASSSSGTSNASSNTTSASSSGNGGSGGSGTMDAGPPICQDPPAPLPEGSLGPASCNCPCGMEAPANLLVIAQDAIAAYQSKGALCTSPPWSVPSLPPPGQCYQPAHHDGEDFFSGSAMSGWACLGVGPALTKPIHCSYHYNAGSGYIAPALGGPDPGPMGFEVTAQGDVDDDGVFSTFSIAGTFDPVSGQFSLSPVFQHDPQE